MSLLLFSAGTDQRAAPIHCRLIAHLEELDAAKFEENRSQPVLVQNRGRLWAPLGRRRRRRPPRAEGQLLRLVSSKEKASLGLACGHTILDIVEDRLDIQLSDAFVGHPRYKACCQCRSTGVIDVGFYLPNQADPAWATAPPSWEARRVRRRVLLVDRIPSSATCSHRLIAAAGYRRNPSRPTCRKRRAALTNDAAFDVVLADTDATTLPTPWPAWPLASCRSRAAAIPKPCPNPIAMRCSTPSNAPCRYKEA